MRALFCGLPFTCNLFSVAHWVLSWWLPVFLIFLIFYGCYLNTHTSSRFTALCPELPGWAGIRRDIHPLTPETFCSSLSVSSFWILWGMGIYNRGKCTINRLDTTQSRASMPQPPSSPQFYAGCPSCRNPPNLSLLVILRRVQHAVVIFMALR